MQYLVMHALTRSRRRSPPNFYVDVPVLVQFAISFGRLHQKACFRLIGQLEEDDYHNLAYMLY